MWPFFIPTISAIFSADRKGGVFMLPFQLGRMGEIRWLVGFRECGGARSLLHVY